MLKIIKSKRGARSNLFTIQIRFLGVVAGFMCYGESKVGEATFISTIVSELLSELGRRLSGLSLSKFRRMIYADVCVLPG